MLLIFLKTLSIFLIVFAGYVIRRSNVVDESFSRQLSLLLLNLCYPALILSSVVRNYTLDTLAANWALPAGAVIIMLTGWTVGRLMRPALRREPEQLRRMFHYQCTINNYSFLPIMFVSALIGERAVAQVIFASLGAELCVWTVGIQALSGKAISRESLRNLVTMPMAALIAACGIIAGVSLVVRCGLGPQMDSYVPRLAGGMLLDTCQTAGQATIPLSAIVCGCRMASLRADHLASRPMLGIVALRLIVIPALAIGLLSLLPMALEARQVMMVVAVQPVAMASVTMAEVYCADAGFAAASVLVTHVLCLVTIPVWLHLAL